MPILQTGKLKRVNKWFQGTASLSVEFRNCSVYESLPLFCNLCCCNVYTPHFSAHLIKSRSLRWEWQTLRYFLPTSFQGVLAHSSQYESDPSIWGPFLYTCTTLQELTSCPTIMFLIFGPTQLLSLLQVSTWVSSSVWRHFLNTSDHRSSISLNFCT